MSDDLDLPALIEWVKNTKADLHKICAELHWDPEEVKKWSSPQDRCYCEVCFLEVPRKTYDKHKTTCQIKKLLPIPKALEVNPSSKPFYDNAPLVVSFERTQKPLEIQPTEVQAAPAPQAPLSVPLQQSGLLHIPKFSEMNDVEVVEPQDSLPSIVDQAHFLPDSKFKENLPKFSKIPSLFVFFSFDMIPEEHLRNWVFRNVFNFSSAFQSVEALEWLLKTIKETTGGPDELSKKLYNPFANYSPYFVLELWKFLILQTLEVNPQYFYETVQAQVQKQQILNQQQTKDIIDDGYWDISKEPSEHVTNEISLDFVEEYLAQKKIPTEQQKSFHQQLVIKAKEERERREREQNQKILDVKQVPDLLITTNRERLYWEKLAEERDNKRRRHRYKEAKKSAVEVMRGNVLLLMNDMYEHLKQQEDEKGVKRERDGRNDDRRDDGRTERRDDRNEGRRERDAKGGERHDRRYERRGERTDDERRDRREGDRRDEGRSDRRDRRSERREHERDERRDGTEYRRSERKRDGVGDERDSRRREDDTLDERRSDRRDRRSDRRDEHGRDERDHERGSKRDHEGRKRHRDDREKTEENSKMREHEGDHCHDKSTKHGERDEREGSRKRYKPRHHDTQDSDYSKSRDDRRHVKERSEDEADDSRKQGRVGERREEVVRIKEEGGDEEEGEITGEKTYRIASFEATNTTNQQQQARVTQLEEWFSNLPFAIESEINRKFSEPEKRN